MTIDALWEIEQRERPQTHYRVPRQYQRDRLWPNRVYRAPTEEPEPIDQRYARLPWNSGVARRIPVYNQYIANIERRRTLRNTTRRLNDLYALFDDYLSRAHAEDDHEVRRALRVCLTVPHDFRLHRQQVNRLRELRGLPCLR